MPIASLPVCQLRLVVRVSSLPPVVRAIHLVVPGRMVTGTSNNRGLGTVQKSGASGPEGLHEEDDGQRTVATTESDSASHE